MDFDGFFIFFPWFSCVFGRFWHRDGFVFDVPGRFHGDFVQVKRRSLVMEDLGDEMLHQLSTAKAQVKKTEDVVPRRGFSDGFSIVFRSFS